MLEIKVITNDVRTSEVKPYNLEYAAELKNSHI